MVVVVVVVVVALPFDKGGLCVCAVCQVKARFRVPFLGPHHPGRTMI